MNYNTKKLQEMLRKHEEDMKDKEPVLKGCRNKVCHCTGECKEVVGYRPKTNLRNFL